MVGDAKMITSKVLGCRDAASSHILLMRLLNLLLLLINKVQIDLI